MRLRRGSTKETVALYQTGMCTVDGKARAIDRWVVPDRSKGLNFGDLSGCSYLRCLANSPRVDDLICHWGQPWSRRIFLIFEIPTLQAKRSRACVW